MPSPDIQGQTVMSLKYTPIFPASTPHATGIFYTIQKLSLKTHECAPQVTYVTSFSACVNALKAQIMSHLFIKPAQNDFLF